MLCTAVDNRELSEFGVKFAIELSDQLSKNHVLLSAVDPPHGVACRRLHRFICLTVLLTSLLTLTAVWYGLVRTASHYELMTGTSIFRISDAGVTLVVALISSLLAALLLEIFHYSNRKVCIVFWQHLSHALWIMD